MQATRSPFDNRTRTRRSVLKQSLRSGPLEARRTAFSVALAIFWRMRGEVQRAGTAAPGHKKYGSGLRDRPAGLERVARRHDHPDHASAGIGLPSAAPARRPAD